VDVVVVAAAEASISVVIDVAVGDCVELGRRRRSRSTLKIADAAVAFDVDKAEK
jgi:hypothetical protein